jgi:import inner membrane translocase subunit TIM23
MSLFDFLRDKKSPESATASQTSTSIASGVSFAKPENITVPDVVTATDVLAGAYDPSKLHPLAGIKEGLDYLSLDDDNINALPGAATALPSRGFSDDLCYGTGTTYLAGRIHSLSLSLSVFILISIMLLFPYSSQIVAMSALLACQGLGIGGLWGLREGLTRPMAVSNARLRLNSVLNGVTRRGTFLGNSAGVLGMP